MIKDVALTHDELIFIIDAMAGSTELFMDKESPDQNKIIDTFASSATKLTQAGYIKLHNKLNNIHEQMHERLPVFDARVN